MFYLRIFLRGWLGMKIVYHKPENEDLLKKMQVSIKQLFSKFFHYANHSRAILQVQFVCVFVWHPNLRSIGKIICKYIKICYVKWEASGIGRYLETNVSKLQTAFEFNFFVNALISSKFGKFLQVTTYKNSANFDRT